MNLEDIKSHEDRLNVHFEWLLDILADLKLKNPSWNSIIEPIEERAQELLARGTIEEKFKWGRKFADLIEEHGATEALLRFQPGNEDEIVTHH